MPIVAVFSMKDIIGFIVLGIIIIITVVVMIRLQISSAIDNARDKKYRELRCQKQKRWLENHKELFPDDLIPIADKYFNLIMDGERVVAGKLIERSYCGKYCKYCKIVNNGDPGGYASCTEGHHGYEDRSYCTHVPFIAMDENYNTKIEECERDV